MSKGNKRNLKTIVCTGNSKDFFDRGLKLAKSLDEKKTITTRRRIITFEDPKDMIKFISDKKMTLMKLIRTKPDSVTKLAKILRRQRSSVDRDIRVLEAYGLVKTHYSVHPGHGRYKVVEPMSPYPVEIHSRF